MIEYVKNKHGLKAPKEFWLLSQEQIRDVSNGCGPKGWGWIVPDHFHLIGINFTPACDIHDFMYNSSYEKKESDNLFLHNMLTIAGRRPFIWGAIGEHFAFLYYLAVKNGGALAYNNAKQSSKEV